MKLSEIKTNNQELKENDSSLNMSDDELIMRAEEVVQRMSHSNLPLSDVSVIITMITRFKNYFKLG
jgi:hypothetical protein